MDTRSLECLQFGEILGRVAESCRSPLGRELIESAQPGTTAEDVNARLAPVAEAMALYDRGQELSLDGLGDPRPLWKAVGPLGHALESEQLLHVANFLEASRRAQDFLRDVRKSAPALAALGEGLAPAPVLERDLRRAIEPDGSVSDRASDALARARSAIRTAESRLRDRVDRLLGELGETGVLQDAFATTRDGRYVFPVRVAAKNRVQGILHGSSKTGETVFIEPAPLVTMSNEIEELRQEEAREALRVRLALTERIRPYLGQFQGDTERLAALDSVWGRARAARRFGWAIPVLQDRTPLRLLDAHHPLLHLRDSATSIPIRLALDPDDRSVVITGPNAGGKTTFLKTFGLAVLLLQSGIPAPVSPDCRLPVFNQVWADIGDAQDVASGQSTFSAHARRLALILERTRERSLVLLDELGTATDPAEGAALAEAVLDVLRRRGCLTLATTHLTPLKQWAHETPNARNASFALDSKTRTPTFTLLLDIPGTSEAMVIAEREGIPPEILDMARKKLGRAEVELGQLLRMVGSRERTLAEAETDLRRRLDTLAHQEELARRRAEAFREERRRFREETARQRERHLAELREEIESRIADLPSREAELQRQRAELTRARREAQELQREAQRERRRAEDSLPPALENDDLAPGRPVFVIDLREVGQLLAVDRDRRKAQVALGRGLVVEVPLDGLSRTPDETPTLAPLRGVDAPARAFTEAELLGLEPGGAGSAKKKSAKVKASKKIKRQEKSAKDASSPALFGATTDGGGWGDAPRNLGWKAGKRKRPDAEAGFRSRRGGGAAATTPGTAKSGGGAETGDGAPPEPGLTGLSAIRYSRKSAVPWQIDLHGHRVEEAFEVIDKYLDDAVVAGMPYAKLCHGLGTGRLARAIREFLAAHPHVRAWRYGQPEEGGAGVTIVELQ